MIIRSARRDDALPIATIHVRSWQVAYRGVVPDEFLDAMSIEERHLRWQQILEVGQSATWIAEEGDIALGWISAGANRDSDSTQSSGEIWAVYIDPDHWRKGVGRALCTVAEQELRSRGYREVTLWVLEGNERAIRFYQSIGFAHDTCEARITERGGRSVREVHLRKQLP
jgi:ribosomal protein S18 acetylase RimI-like enzyme